MEHSSAAIFNSPLEAGLRVLTLLVEAHPNVMDLQKLVFLDYLSVHTADVNGPSSLHPPTPHRSAELVIRRELLDKGALLMVSRGLVHRWFSESGFTYSATEEAGMFLASLKATYTSDLRDRTRWVIEHYGSMATEELSGFFNENLDRWGGEFALASRLEEVPS